MDKTFFPNGLPVLIGSLPLAEHNEAIQLVTAHTPEIPLWVQLPVYFEEGMIIQFLSGLPGLEVTEDKFFINTVSDTFNDQLVAFYEEYMGVQEGNGDLDDSRFVLSPDSARGFFVFLNHVAHMPVPPKAVKGQITGPVTITTGVKDQSGRAIYYDHQLRDAAVKMIAMKAKWQARKLGQLGYPVIIFFDEPALAGFGTSEFISMSFDEVSQCYGEVIEAVHGEGALAGIHVCANTEWPLVLNSQADIVSFDAYAHFDRFILYKQELKRFLDAGKCIAWGIVPTLDVKDIEAETADSLVQRWHQYAGQVTELGISRQQLVRQSLITPACGTGSLSIDHATRVLELTKEVSLKIRQESD